MEIYICFCLDGELILSYLVMACFNILFQIKPRGAMSFVLDNQSYLIAFAFIAAAVALILRHIPFKSAGQAFIA